MKWQSPSGQSAAGITVPQLQLKWPNHDSWVSESNSWALLPEKCDQECHLERNEALGPANSKLQTAHCKPLISHENKSLLTVASLQVQMVTLDSWWLLTHDSWDSWQINFLLQLGCYCSCPYIATLTQWWNSEWIYQYIISELSCNLQHETKGQARSPESWGRDINTFLHTGSLSQLVEVNTCPGVILEVLPVRCASKGPHSIPMIAFPKTLACCVTVSQCVAGLAGWFKLILFNSTQSIHMDGCTCLT